MKYTHRLQAAATACLLGFAACSDDDGNGPGTNGTITATIDQTIQWSGSASVQATYAGNVLAVGGVNGSSQQILITLPNVTATGTYNLGLGQLGVAQVIFGTQAWTTALTDGTGSVMITALSSTHAVGDFTFTAIANTTTGATGTKVVSSGHFDVTF